MTFLLLLHEIIFPNPEHMGRRDSMKLFRLMQWRNSDVPYPKVLPSFTSPYYAGRAAEKKTENAWIVRMRSVAFGSRVVAFTMFYSFSVAFCSYYNSECCRLKQLQGMIKTRDPQNN